VWPIGVVTSVWGNYGHHLPGWVDSIVGQTLKPELVTIVDLGVDDIGPGREALETSGLDWQIITGDYRGMGPARNRAVEATSAEWVMHLDADDVLLPHAINDVAEIAPDTDVVSVGMYLGDREHLFVNVSARDALKGRLAAFSCAAFRRELWEQSPWHEANDWIDSAFWLNLARRGARFKGTARAGAVYRQHEGSFSQRMTPLEKRAAKAQLHRMVTHPGWSP
jgi:hypothetical protein